MQIKKFLAAFFVALFFMVGNCSAKGMIPGNDDPAALEDMNQNPQNYILCGGIGTGVSVYIYKNSIDVQKYTPPEYVIVLKKIYYNVNRGVSTSSKIEKYRYDLNKREIYIEMYGRDGRIEWELLNPLQFGSGGGRSILATGEIAFYLAYKMSFFDKPITDFAKRYIETGAGTFDNR